MAKILQAKKGKKINFSKILVVALFFHLILSGCNGKGWDDGGDSNITSFPSLTPAQKTGADKHYSSVYPDGEVSGLTGCMEWAEAPYTFVRKFVIEQSSVYKFTFFLTSQNKGYEGAKLVLYDEDSNIVEGIKADPDATVSYSDLVLDMSNIKSYDTPTGASSFKATLYAGKTYYLKYAAQEQDSDEVISICMTEVIKYITPGKTSSIEVTQGPMMIKL